MVVYVLATWCFCKVDFRNVFERGGGDISYFCFATMLLWFCYTIVTLLFILIGMSTVHIGGLVTWLMLPGIAGCFMLVALASRRIFFEPQRGFRNAMTGCLLMLPLFTFVFLPTYGIPLGVTLLVMYYTKVMMRKDPSAEQMQRFTSTWRIKLASGFLAAFMCLMLLVLLLNCFHVTKGIFPIEGNAVVLWKPRP